MSLSFENVDGFVSSVRKHIDKTKVEVEAVRRAAVRTFVEALMKNIPVWSGRTIASITVSNTGAKASLKGDPPRTQWSAFGRTSLMALGSEPMRAAAEAQAMGEVTSANYAFDKPVFITIHSEAWGLVERGAAPDTGRARNSSVVSRIALQKMQASHPQIR